MDKSRMMLLVVLDGFGIREDKAYNGVFNSKMKNYFSFWNKYPHTHLHASGPLVGLPENQIGSSEVGHMTIGAGRLIKEPIVKINEDIDSGVFFKNSKLIEDLEFVKKSGGNVHLMGLLGPGGVHSVDKHLYAFLDFYDRNSDWIEGKVFIHNFLDGRDTAQKSALGFLDDLNKKVDSLKNKDKFVVSTICGRYYAMDRDKRWDRTKLAYDMLVYGVGNSVQDGKVAIESSYKNKIYDEFVKPSIVYLKPIKDNDLVVFYNFRSDRPKQLVRAFKEKGFDKFDVKRFENLRLVTLTQYCLDIDAIVLYPTHFPKETFGEVISNAGLRQLRIAETEKFPHVTYFFSGLRYEKFKGEEHVKVNSPKVATYDLQPEMSCDEVSEKLIESIKSKRYDFILLNFANSDMVGHTGDYEAVIEAMKRVDKHLGLIKEEVDKVNGLMMITSDHGNCESMRDENDKPHTKHTYNLVPFVLLDERYKLRKDYYNLSLFNIAPTMLDILGIEKPKSMTGKSLIVR